LVEGVALIDEKFSSAHCARVFAHIAANANQTVKAKIAAIIEKNPVTTKKATKAQLKAQLKALAPAVEKNNGSTMTRTRQE
jgi:hypothetical protein